MRGTTDEQKIIGLICAYKCANPSEPICLVGHSWGAKAAINIADYFVAHGCRCLEWHFESGAGCEDLGGQWILRERIMPVRIAYLGMIDAVGWAFEATSKDVIPTSVDNVSNDYQTTGVVHGEPVTVTEPTKLIHEASWTGVKADAPTAHPGHGQPMNHTNIDNDLRVKSGILSNLGKYDSR